MRKIIIAAAVAGAVLTGCSDGTQEADTAATSETAADAAATPAAATPAAPDAALNANTATAEQLTGAGVSAEAAEAIVAGRPYASVVALNTKLREILSEEAAGGVLENVFIPVNLNTASRKEIELIPGMTDRMVHEFEEYRPYEDMAEFDREIGKYVDKAEVARFRRYVTL